MEIFEINTEIKLLKCDMAVQHLTLWISNIMAVKSAMLMHQRYEGQFKGLQISNWCWRI
jgi:hypothetical protein